MIAKKLYWSRYRPKNVEGMILLPRIYNELYNENGELTLSGNYLFVGTSGIGKTTLAKIITPEDALIINASYNSSIEDLKDQVMEYCRTQDIFGKSTIDGYKIVYLDEFDGVSAKYQEALRGFIEDFEDRVRFICTANNLHKLSPAMQSRFTVIKFDPTNTEETKFLKEEYFERCKLIQEKNKINISDEQIKSLININFPDLRSVFNALQRVEKNGTYTTNVNTSINVDLYNILFEKINTEKTYNWVIEIFGDNIESLLKLCGRPLSEYIMEYQKEHINKLPKIIKTVCNYSNDLNNCIDPLIVGLACIYEIQETINIK